MKKNITLKAIVCILVTILLLQSSSYAFAHPSSQVGILAESYHAEYEGYYIGGETVGWSIDEDIHTNGTTLTYSFSTSDSYLSSTYKSYVTTGASRWSGTVTITNKTDGTGVGTISTFYNPNSGTIAQFCQWSTNSSGHLTSWEIQMNRAKSQSSAILAHEFGHAIGLNDLYADKNVDKLMYGYSSGTATSPSTADQWGAKVITGVHTSHTWSFKYHSTNSNGTNNHVRFCTLCGGLTDTVSPCVYANNVCRVCGIPRGETPYSTDPEQYTI